MSTRISVNSCLFWSARTDFGQLVPVLVNRYMYLCQKGGYYLCQKGGYYLKEDRVTWNILARFTDLYTFIIKIDR